MIGYEKHNFEHVLNFSFFFSMTQSEEKEIKDLADRKNPETETDETWNSKIIDKKDVLEEIEKMI